MVVINGMAMVQKPKDDHKTFAEVVDSLLSMVLQEGTESQCIDMVFKVYRDNPIKNAQREKHGSETGHEFRYIKADHKIHQWRQFLSNAKNRSLLIKFISEESQNDRCRCRGLLERIR